MVRLPLHTSLDELVETYSRTHNISSELHTTECRLAPQPTPEDSSQQSDQEHHLTACQGINCAIHTVSLWVADVSTSGGSSPAPYQHLLMLVSALSTSAAQSSTTASTVTCHDTSLLASSCRALTDAAVQLCRAAEAAALGLASKHAEATAHLAHPAHPAGAATPVAAGVMPPAQTYLERREQEEQQGQHSSQLATADAAGMHRSTAIPHAPGSQHTNPAQQPHQDDQQHNQAAAVAEAAETYKSLLFWSCHLTTALHKFISNAQPTSSANPTTNRRKTTAKAPTDTPPAVTAAAAPSAGYTLQAKLQQRWAQKSLPTAQQHLLACYLQLVGADNSKSGSASSSAAQCGASTAAAAAAVTGWQRVAELECGACPVPFSTKQQTSLDQLLYGSCLAFLNTTTSSSISSSNRKAGKPPAKQAKHAAPGANSSSSSTAVLALESLDLLASCIGCHMLFRHQQQLQQVIKKSKRQPRSSSSSSSWRWCDEAARILADPQQQHLHPMLLQALVSLLRNPSTRAAACNMLCAAAEAICSPSAAIGASGAGDDAGARAPKHTNKQSAGGAAAAAAVNSQSSLLLLELLSALLCTHCPSEWPCITPAVGRTLLHMQTAAATGDGAAKDAGATQTGPGNASTSAAAAAAMPAAVASMPPDTLRQLLASSLLPQLQPVATLCSSAAARKLWLSVAAVAASPVPPKLVPAAAAAAGMSRVGPVTAAGAGAATAASKGQVAGLVALSAAAHSDKDATVRSKALSLLQQATPAFLQAWQYWTLQQQEQQREKQAARLAQQQLQQQQVVVEDPATLQSQETPYTLAGLKPAGMSASPTEAAESDVGYTARLVSEGLSGLRSAAAAIATALDSQLLGSSKASRLKAVQLLQQLLQPAPKLPKAVRAVAAAAADEEVSAGSGRHGSVQQLQQQLVRVTFPAICSILAAGQDSQLYCPNCKAAAVQLLPAMAGVLQPQQALHLALTHSSSSSSSTGTTSASKQDGQEDESYQDPAALMLASLAKCSSQQLYELIKRQVCATTGMATQPAPAAEAGAAAAAPGAEAGAADDSGPVAGRSKGLAETRCMLQQLQHMVAGLQGKEGLRRHAFIQACQALTKAADAAAAAAPAPAPAPAPADGAPAPRAAGTEDTAAAAAAGTEELVREAASAAMLEQQQALLQAMQLLQVCGGCGSSSPSDMRAELAILVDALDLCCMWLQEGSAAGAAATAAAGSSAVEDPAAEMLPGCAENLNGFASHGRVVGATVNGSQDAAAAPQFQQQLQGTCSLEHVSLALCQELLRTVVCILDSALIAAATAAAAAFKPETSPAAAAAAAGSSSVWCTQWMWGEVGACLMHHLGEMVSYSAGIGPVRLPVSTLDVYLKVLCSANRNQQLLLHELLCTWHKQLAQGRQAAAAAAASVPNSSSAPATCGEAAGTLTTTAAEASNAVAAVHARVVAFLLLVKHLSGFYAVEQALFRQRVVNAMKASAAGAAAAGTDTDMAAGAGQQTSGDNQQQQQQQRFDYMLGEEEAACVEASTARFTADLLAETAPACYLPLLLQLVRARVAPTHVRVLALQALEPLLLDSADLTSCHSGTLAALLTDPHAPSALLLQGVSTAGSIITARPADSSLLVQHLEQLILSALASPSNSSSGVPSMAADAGSEPGQQQQSGHGAPTAMAAAAVAAAGWYCQLLLSEKLLLTGYSWGLVAQGLLATGPLQGVADAMQHLIKALLQQQRTPRSKVALDLLLNYASAHMQARPNSSTAAATGVTPANDGGGVAAAASSSSSMVVRQAEALVQQVLTLDLNPKELSSESLTLPLLQAITMAANSGWGGPRAGMQHGNGNDSSSRREVVASSQGSTVAAAALLRACTPSAKCLEMLLRTCHAHKHSMARHCNSSILAHLATFVGNYSSSRSSNTSNSRFKQSGAEADDAADVGGIRAASAAVVSSGQHAGVQQQLLTLLQGMRASAAASATADAGATLDSVLPEVLQAPPATAAAAAAGAGPTVGGGPAAAHGNASDEDEDWEQPVEQRVCRSERHSRGLQGTPAPGTKPKPSSRVATAGGVRPAGRHQAGSRGTAAGDAGGGVEGRGVRSHVEGGSGSKRSRGAAKLPAGKDSGGSDAQAALQRLLQERQKGLQQLQRLSK